MGAMMERGEVLPSTLLRNLKGVGEGMEARLRASLLPPSSRTNLTVEVFLRRMRGLASREIEDFLRRSLSNERRNTCVPTRNRRGETFSVHVRDVNLGSHTTLVSLLKAARSGKGGPALGRGLTFSSSTLSHHPRRTEGSEVCACLSASECRSSPICKRVGRSCIPRNGRREVGFVGSVSPFDQKVDPRQRRYPSQTRQEREREVALLERQSANAGGGSGGGAFYATDQDTGIRWIQPR